MDTNTTVEAYIKHNSILLKEWFWEDGMLTCVFKREIDDDDMEDFSDSLTMTLLNQMMANPPLTPSKVMLSHDIGEYMDAFYGLIEIDQEYSNIKIKYTNAAHDEKIKVINYRI